MTTYHAADAALLHLHCILIRDVVTLKQLLYILSKGWIKKLYFTPRLIDNYGKK